MIEALPNSVVIALALPAVCDNVFDLMIVFDG
jgi:hypothetical protein